MIDQVTRIMLPICNALLLPVIGLLMLMLIASLMHAGGIAAEWASRIRRHGGLVERITQAKQGNATCLDEITSPTGFSPTDRVLARFREAPAHGGKLLDDLQLDAERRLTRLQLLIRIGPMLGLAGTLIPLGPALQALSQGDFNILAQRLIVAFSTTVIGLFVGGLAFALYTVRRGWYAQDLSDLAFFIDLAGQTLCKEPPSDV